MASLANQTISSTYDGLVKTSTDQPVGVSGVQLLEDGVGNSLALSVGRANQGVTITGTATATAFSGDLTGDVTGDLTGNVTATSVLADGVIATTQATSDNSTKVATTAFVKSVVTAEDLDIAGDTGTGAVDLDSQTLTIAGTANEIETSASGQTITIGLPSTITANVTGNVAGDLAGTVLTAAQTNITSVGTLSSLAVSGDVSIADKIIHTGDTNTAIRFPAADTVTVETGGSERVRVDSSGNVGIGTSSPAAALDVRSTSLPTFRVSRSGSAGSTGTARILFEGREPTLGTGQTAAIDGGAGGGLSFRTGGTSGDTVGGQLAMIINTSGNLEFPNGQGIDFSASAGGGATSSLLDDYEEGTWTMGISFGGASAGVTYTRNTGTYTKIGRQVTVTGHLTLSNKGSSTGSASITGLPFTIPNNPSFYGGAAVGYAANLTFSDQLLFFGETGSTRIDLFETTNAGSTSDLDNTNFANNSDVVFTFTYFV